MKAFEVGGFLIGDTIAPALEHDALPLKGQGAHGGGMSFTFGFLLLEEGFGPGTVEG